MMRGGEPEWEVKLSEIDALLTEQFEHGAVAPP